MASEEYKQAVAAKARQAISEQLKSIPDDHLRQMAMYIARALAHELGAITTAILLTEGLAAQPKVFRACLLALESLASYTRAAQADFDKEMTNHG